MILLGALLPAGVSAQLMDEVFKAMPDTLLPYLNKEKRTELVDFYHIGVKAETKNKLDENTVLDTLTTGMASLRLSESSTLQLLMLPRQGGDTIVCAVKTFFGEAPESTVAFYTRDWQGVTADSVMSEIDARSLVARPDTMTVERYEALLKYIDPWMMEARVSEADLSLTWTLSLPMLSESEKKDLKDIILQRKLKWNGKRFN